MTWAFENATPYAGEQLAKAVASGLVGSEIGWDCDVTAAPPKGPSLKRAEPDAIPEIHVSLKHLELLWSFTYSWMVIYERGIQKPLIDGTWRDEVDLSDPILLRATKLRDWSASLRTVCTPWPQELPSPLHYACDVERWYGGKANLVFQEAVAFLLGHEFGHAKGQHHNFLKNAPDCDAIEAEKDADVAAFESIVMSMDDEDARLSKAWSILSALLSSVYLCTDLRVAFVQRRHPPLHQRLATFLRMLNFGNEQYRYYFPNLTWLILESALDGLETVARSASLEAPYEDAEEAFSDTLDRIERWVGQTSCTLAS